MEGGARSSKFLQRLTNWEFWPAWITNIPVVLFWLYHSARTGSLFFFSAVNPGAVSGGLLGNSKMKILESIPRRYLPVSARFSPSGSTLDAILDFMAARSITFPVILKPDIGERGLMVRRIDSRADLEAYLARANYELILQEYIDYPLEVSVLSYLIPGTGEAGISSVCVKEFLQVTGDGEQSILQLIRQSPRARLYEEVLAETWWQRWKEVPRSGEDIALQPIGNHCKGTKFLNANDRIDQQLVDTFTGILKEMDGFNYGRFDLRCASWEHLKKGEHLRILEFNGVNSEPAHVYDPDYPLWKSYRDFFRQWALMARIYHAQSKLGYKPMRFREAIAQGKKYFQYLQAVKSM